MAQRPNILLLMADQFRGDCLGAEGHPDVKTPYLDMLCERGTRFERAYSATPTCIPARAALLTGMDQRHHGRVGYQDGVVWSYPHTLAGTLAQAGYQTHCAGKMHVHPLRSRQGFDGVDLHDGYLHHYRNASHPYYEHQLQADDYFYEMQGKGHMDLADDGIDCNGWAARPWPYEEQLHPTWWVGDRVMDFLRRRDRDAPFFLMASFVRPHPPFDAPQAFFDMYRGRNLRMPPVGDWAAPVTTRIPNADQGILDDELQRQALIGYYACITQVDHQIGRIYEQLGVEGLLNNTLILFVSDHGELLGDHHLMRKSLPYEGSARIPFVLSGPGIPRGGVSSRVVTLADIMPTLLDYAGVAIPDSVNGASVLGMLTDSDAPWRDMLHGEHTYHGRGMPESVQFMVSSTDKYIWYSGDGREEYFDLVNDPQECCNLIADSKKAARIAQMRARLVQQLTGREEGYVQDGQLVTGRSPRTVLAEAGILG